MRRLRWRRQCCNPGCAALAKSRFTCARIWWSLKACLHYLLVSAIYLSWLGMIVAQTRSSREDPPAPVLDHNKVNTLKINAITKLLPEGGVRPGPFGIPTQVSYLTPSSDAGRILARSSRACAKTMVPGRRWGQYEHGDMRFITIGFELVKKMGFPACRLSQ